MPDKTALVVFDECHPENCNKGICPAVAACPHKLIKQEVHYDKPMFYTATCQGCGDCVTACPLRAIRVVRM